MDITNYLDTCDTDIVFWARDNIRLPSKIVVENHGTEIVLEPIELYSDQATWLEQLSHQQCTVSSRTAGYTKGNTTTLLIAAIHYAIFNRQTPIAYVTTNQAEARRVEMEFRRLYESIYRPELWPQMSQRLLHSNKVELAHGSSVRFMSAADFLEPRGVPEYDMVLVDNIHNSPTTTYAGMLSAATRYEHRGKTFAGL